MPVEETTQAQAVDGQQDAPAQAVDAPEFDLAAAKKLRSENASLRSRMRELEGKVTTFEQANMSEMERLKAELAAAQAQSGELRKARAEVEISREAAKHGADPTLLARLVDVEFDANGQPANVAAAVTEVLSKYPHLKAGYGAQAATMNPGRPAPKLTMDDVKRMTPAEVNSRWDEVQAAMIAAKG